jgi:hypothetical protein
MSAFTGHKPIRQFSISGDATIRPGGICGGKCKMRHRGKPFLAGDVVQFRLKKDGSENLFARMVEMASQPSSGISHPQRILTRF